MRLNLVCMVALLGLSACQTPTISDQAQELARLEQERARLNRAYATAEIMVLEQQKTDTAYAAARIHFQTLRQLRFKACETPASPNQGLRLQFVQCQYDASFKDYQQLYQWQKSQYQFPPRITLPAHMQTTPKQVP